MCWSERKKQTFLRVFLSMVSLQCVSKSHQRAHAHTHTHTLWRWTKELDGLSMFGYDTIW